MASAKSLVSNENICCSICLEVLTKPASIPCGHTFCLDCISRHWEADNAVFECPMCREAFYTKPKLCVNVIIAEMAERFRKVVDKKPSGVSVEANSEEVLCGVCAEPKSAAANSCLVCFMSFCQRHLEPHRSISALKKHKLIKPVRDLENRICKTHDEPLEYFCMSDQIFICESCKITHKSHAVVTLEEEAQVRRSELKNEMELMNQMIEARLLKIQDIRSSLDSSMINADAALSGKTNTMSALVDYIQRSQIELGEVISEKRNHNERAGKSFIKELEAEIMQIKLKKKQLDEVSHTDDPFMLLENVFSRTIPSPRVKDWSRVSLNAETFDVQEALDEMEAVITKEINTVCDPTFKERQMHAVDLTFDPDTASPYLYISENGKRVAHENRKRPVQNKRERFDALNVLAKEGFSSGKFYYEVQVKDKTQWDLGVANESINRKGDIRLSPKNGYWTIWLRKGNEFTANTGSATNLRVREVPLKVGVFVDYEEGQVIFYNADTRVNIFTFTGCKFNETLFPFFSPGSNDRGKNSAPLIITPVTQRQ